MGCGRGRAGSAHVCVLRGGPDDPAATKTDRIHLRATNHCPDSPYASPAAIRPSWPFICSVVGHANKCPNVEVCGRTHRRAGPGRTGRRRAGRSEVGSRAPATRRAAATERVIIRSQSGRLAELRQLLRSCGAKIQGEHSLIDALTAEVKNECLQKLLANDVVESVGSDAEVFGDSERVLRPHDDCVEHAAEHAGEPANTRPALASASPSSIQASRRCRPSAAASSASTISLTAASSRRRPTTSTATAPTSRG